MSSYNTRSRLYTVDYRIQGEKDIILPSIFLALRLLYLSPTTTIFHFHFHDIQRLILTLTPLMPLRSLTSLVIHDMILCR